jgi:CBS domain-containing protein
MAAITAGTSHAPISAIMILFEMTGNYDLILPLMIASIIASLLSRKLHPHSIYLDPLHRKGLVLSRRPAEAALAELPVKNLVREDHEQLRPSDGFNLVVDRFLSTRRQRLFVVHPDGRLLGEVSIHDIKHILDEARGIPGIVVHDLMRPSTIMAREDDRLDRAIQAFSESDHERIPVVDVAGRYRGFLAKRDVLSLYARELQGQKVLTTTFISGPPGDGAEQKVELPHDYVVRVVAIPPSLAGRSLEEAAFPQKYGVRVIEIRRPTSNPELVIPHAASVLEAGDRLIVLGTTAEVRAFLEACRSSPAESPGSPAL